MLRAAAAAFRKEQSLAAGVTAKLTAPRASVQHHIIFLGMVLVVVVIDMVLLIVRVMDVDVFIFYLHGITLMGGLKLEVQGGKIFDRLLLYDRLDDRSASSGNTWGTDNYMNDDAAAAAPCQGGARYESMARHKGLHHLAGRRGRPPHGCRSVPNGVPQAGRAMEV
jgi:hypothetical protein